MNQALNDLQKTRDGRQHRIAEFVVHRKMQLGVALIPRLEAPHGT
jgi:hypothetical protein